MLTIGLLKVSTWYIYCENETLVENSFDWKYFKCQSFAFYVFVKYAIKWNKIKYFRLHQFIIGNHSVITGNITAYSQFHWVLPCTDRDVGVLDHSPGPLLSVDGEAPVVQQVTRAAIILRSGDFTKCTKNAHWNKPYLNWPLCSSQVAKAVLCIRDEKSSPHVHTAVVRLGGVDTENVHRHIVEGHLVTHWRLEKLEMDSQAGRQANICFGMQEGLQSLLEPLREVSTWVYIVQCWVAWCSWCPHCRPGSSAVHMSQVTSYLLAPLCIFWMFRSDDNLNPKLRRFRSRGLLPPHPSTLGATSIFVNLHDFQKIP